MKKIIKNQKGITMVTLLVTIIIIAILAGVTFSNIDIGTDIKDYNYMCADIELLQTKIQNYYNENGTIPISDEVTNAGTTLGEQATSRDEGGKYYKININKLYNITLNFGGGTVENGDIYIINDKSHEIYYLKGTLLENTRYYRKK